MSALRAPRPPCVGILAIQGAVAEHARALRAAGSESRPVLVPADLEGLDGLVLPGGESTTFGRVGGESGLLAAIGERVAAGLPVLGTCAGLILLADEVIGGALATIGGLDVRVRRNAYGRQRASFEAPIAMPAVGEEPFPGIFIRAPWIVEVGPGVEVLAEHGGRVVAVRQGSLLATAFHPELTSDPRAHRLFIDALRPAGRSRRPGAEGRTRVRSQ